jgi:hypothetical protein
MRKMSGENLAEKQNLGDLKLVTLVQRKLETYRELFEYCINI